MKRIESVLIAGSGAVGAMVAHRCFKTIPQGTRILASGERLERYRKEGIVINGEKIPFEFSDVAEKSESDLIIIASKYHHLPQIIEDIKNHVGKDTIILSLLNGIDSEEKIGAVYGRERLPLAFIIGTDTQRNGTHVSFENEGTIVFGAPTNNLRNLDEREKRIADFFDRCGISYQIPENMLQKQWFKFMMNVGINQISAVSRKSYQFFQRKNGIPKYPRLFNLLEDTMREVVAVAKAEGVLLTKDDMEEVYTVLDSIDSESYTSMCQDVLAKRKTEIEMFAPVVSDLGKKHGIATPINDMLYTLLVAIEMYR